MKTLLIISSVILISFQTTRIFTEYLSGSGNEITFINNTHRLSPATTAYDLKAAESNNLNNIITADNTTEENAQPEVKTITRSTASLTKNQKNSAFHHAIIESGNYIMLSSLHFNFNQFEDVNTEEFNIIMDFANLLIFNDTLKVSVAGFTDNTGDPAYNEYLSYRRAQNVKDYFLELGVNDKQIIVSANGIDNPIASNATREGRAANRRVEMLLIK
ncbi:MAG: OmpA family protein [Chitinophagaceae bacterium]|nr:OmpA family protein [Chitinophagaceae bacterium]